MPAVAPHRVLIVGAGFAGFALARALDSLLTRLGRVPLQATLIAASPFAQLSPLLPGIISGWVEPWQALVPLKPSLRHIDWLHARAVALDPASRTLTVDTPPSVGPSDPHPLAFDDLVLAVGTAPSVHQVEGAPARALPVACLHDAIRVRNRLADALDAASVEHSSRRRRALLTVAVLGNSSRACTAALECAAHLRDAQQHFPRIRPEEPRVLLVSSSARVCEDLPPRDEPAVLRLLASVGIEVMTHRRPLHVADRHLVVQTPTDDSELLDTRTVVWTMPGAPAALLADRAAWMAEHGRLRVDETLRVSGVANLFAIGSCAAAPAQSGQRSADSPTRVLAEARALARNLVARARGHALLPLKEPLLDALAIDRDWGWAALGSRRLSGRAAACIARNLVVGLAPRWSQRQAVRVSWALHRLSPPAMAPRLQPALPSLVLTGVPPDVTSRPIDPPGFPATRP